MTKRKQYAWGLELQYFLVEGKDWGIRAIRILGQNSESFAWVVQCSRGGARGKRLPAVSELATV